MATDFYGEYLRDLAALDDFLSRRRRGGSLVEPEDPDVRRLTESLAFFSARTRVAATESLSNAVHELTNGLLDDFIYPQPARALLRARARPGLVEAANLPRGTVVRVEADDGAAAQFTTMRELTIRPLEIDRANWEPRSQGARVVLRLRAFGPSYRLDTPVSIQVSLPGGDYLRTREFFWYLETALARVGVVYDESPASDDLGQACAFSVGESLDAEDSAAAMRHEQRSVQRSGSIAKIREFFHFPQADLRFDVQLAAPSNKRTWRQAWLVLDFDAWPEGQRVNKDMFQLHTVPIENLLAGDALAFTADGTRVTFPVLPARQDRELEFHSMLEVTQERPTGVEPILPGYLAGGNESWSLERREAGELPNLRLFLPAAFIEPRLIMAKARWFQPAFEQRPLGKLVPTLQNRHVDGAQFELVGRLTPHRPSALADEPQALLHVLSRRSKWELSREDIVMMLRVLGADEDSYHAEVHTLLRQIEVVDQPADPGSAGGVRHDYRITLAEEAREVEQRALVRDYLAAVEQLVNTWSNNPATVSLTSSSRAPTSLRSVS